MTGVGVGVILKGSTFPLNGRTPLVIGSDKIFASVAPVGITEAAAVGKIADGKTVFAKGYGLLLLLPPPPPPLSLPP